MRTPLFDAELRALMDRPLLPTDSFLSLYLDAAVNEHGHREMRPFLDKRAKTARARLARLPADLRGYDELIERIRRDVLSRDLEGIQGLAVFAEIPPIGGEPGGAVPVFRVVELPVRVESRFILGRGPDLGPLLRAVGTYVHYLAVRLDADDARLLSVYLARVVGAGSEQAEGPDREVAGRIRSQPGGWSQMRFQRRKAVHVQHWFGDLAERLRRLALRERPAGIVLLGQDVNVAAFERELPEWLRAFVVRRGTVEPHATDAEILALVEPLVEATRSVDGARLIDELYDRVLRDFFAVGGIDDTLAALQQGKVETLLVSRRFDAHGGLCRRCGFLVSAEHRDCPYCGGMLVEVPLLQHLVRRAEEQEAEVRLVDERDPRLESELEGVGALLRF